MNSLSIDHSLCFFFFVRYPCWMTARLLLECDANVNSLNNDGNTPLHILLQSSTMSNVMKMIDLLCDAGAHLDYVNQQKQTPLELVPAYRYKIVEQLKKKMNVTQLKCLCAQIIRRKDLFYQDGILSSSLVNFVEKH